MRKRASKARPLIMGRTPKTYMSIYEKLKNCSEEDVFDLVTSDPDLETDGSWGIIEKLKFEFPEVQSLNSILDEGERIKELDKKLDGKTILFVSQSNGTSDLLFKIEKDDEVEKNNKLYGFAYAINYVPVKILPNLWRTPGNIVDAHIENYANSVARGKKPESGRLLKNVNAIEGYLLKYWWHFVSALVLFLVLVIVAG